MFALRGKLDYADSSSVALYSDVDADVIDVLTTLDSALSKRNLRCKSTRDVKDVDQRVAAALQLWTRANS